MAPLLHTPEEAAELLRCKASWLKDKARLREIPFTRIGGAYRFSDAHLERIVAQFEQTPDRQAGQPKAAAPRRRPAPAAAPAGTVRRLTANPPKRVRTAS